MATENLNATFIGDALGGSGGAGDDIRKKLILAMLQEGTSGAPVAHFTQGLDRIAKAMLGGLELRDLDRSDRAHMAALTNMLTGGGGGGPGVAPGGGRPVESGPRSASLPPMGVDPEPPRNPPGTFPVRQATEGLDIPMPPQPGGAGGGFPARDPAQIAQALRGGGGVNLANMPGGPGSPEDMGPPLRPPSGAAALAAPMPPRPDPTMALQPPAESAGAMPPPLAPPGPPAAGQRQSTPPAPTAPPPGAVPGTLPEQRRAMVQMMLHPRTPPAAKAMIAQQLNPKWETKTLPNGDIAAINERTNEVRIIHKGEPKPTDDSLNLKEFNDSLPPGQKRLTLPEFKALQEGTKTTAELRAKKDFTEAERQGAKAVATAIVSQDINRTIDKINKSSGPTTGIVGSGLARAGLYQPAVDVAESLQTVKSNIGLDKLQEMREQSPTGGALGSVTREEHAIVQSVYGSLEQSQSREQLIQNLRRLDRVRNAIVNEGLPGAVRVLNEGRGGQPQVGGAQQGGASSGGWQDVGGGIRIRERR